MYRQGNRAVIIRPAANGLDRHAPNKQQIASAQRTATTRLKPGPSGRFFEHARKRNSATIRVGGKKNVSSGDSSMATQIVMDHSGDTRHHFDANDSKALADAERRFKALTG